MPQPTRGRGGHLVFHISPKNTNLVDGIAILLPVSFVEFRSAVSEKSKNVSANQRPGPPSCFSNLPENTNLVEDVEILLTVKFRRIPFRGEFENVRS